MDSEKWIAIPNYPNYEASSNGAIRSLDRHIDSRNKKGLLYSRPIKGKILKPHVTQYGYEQVALCKNGKLKSFLVHSLVAKSFHGDKRPLHINHMDGDKRNNASSNLEWITQKENSEHAVENNLYPRGCTHHLSKYSKDDVIKIKAMLTLKNNGANISMRQIAKITGCYADLVRDIFNGKRRIYE